MKLVVLCSGYGTNFENILRTVHKHEVVLMIHNKEKCGAVKRAAKFGVPHIHIPHKDEDLMIRTIRAFHPDLIVLAGYMRILSSRFVGSFDRLINVHPSLLPKYRGGSPMQHQIINGEKESAVTLFYMDEGIDTDAKWQVFQINKMGNSILNTANKHGIASLSYTPKTFTAAT